MASTRSACFSRKRSRPISEWSATLSDISITGLTDITLPVGGDSVRIEETDARCKYTGFWEDYKYGATPAWPSQWWSDGHAKRCAPGDVSDVRAVVITY